MKEIDGDTDFISWSPNGQNLALVNRKNKTSFIILSLENGEIQADIDIGHTMDDDINWSPDGEMIASPMQGSEIGIWYSDNYKKYRSFNGGQPHDQIDHKKRENRDKPQGKKIKPSFFFYPLVNGRKF